MSIRIKLASIIVDDQEKALTFYTRVVGFVKRIDMPAGDFRWLTVVSPDGPNDIELLLEPNANPAGRTYQKALYDQGIPATTFTVDDVEKEYSRMRRLGGIFRGEPKTMGPVRIATFDDTCGNWIQLVQPPEDTRPLDL